jgi:hypothetical protein
MLEMGADASVLNIRLTAAMDSAEKLGNKSGASMLDFLIRALFPGPEPAPKPSFRIV